MEAIIVLIFYIPLGMVISLEFIKATLIFYPNTRYWRTPEPGEKYIVNESLSGFFFGLAIVLIFSILWPLLVCISFILFCSKASTYKYYSKLLKNNWVKIESQKDQISELEREIRKLKSNTAEEQLKRVQIEWKKIEMEKAMLQNEKERLNKAWEEFNDLKYYRFGD